MIKAAAWYVVCYEQLEDDTMREMSEGFLSFAWIPDMYFLKLLSACVGQFSIGILEQIGLGIYSLLKDKAAWLLEAYKQQLTVK